MARIQLFEWEDQPWLPRILRDFITDHLQYTFSGPRAEVLRQTVAGILLPALRRSNADRIVDVCSGGGGPLPSLLPLLEKELGRPLQATMTDRFPNANSFAEIERASRGKIRGALEPVSAFDVPIALGSFQTLFTAFHHFDEASAKRILIDAAAKRRTLAIIEPFRRRDTLLVGIGGFLRGVILTPRVGRLTLGRFLVSYPVPISALILGWDGAVSCLRAYSADDMLRLARQAVPFGYRWEAGVKPIEGSPVGLAITYLIGEPEFS